MNVFQLIKTVLDDEYSELTIAGADKDASVKERLAKLSRGYGRLTVAAPEHDYADPVTRLAYVFRYVTSHAHLVAEAVRSCDEITKLLSQDRVTVSCIGGGPGSDFLGLLKYQIDQGWGGVFRCFLLDAEAGWGDAWTDVGDRLGTMSFTVFTHFQQLDVTTPATWTAQRKYLKADLFTTVYFISEVYGFREKAEPFFDHLFNSAASGALFLFIDNDAVAFSGWFEEIVARNGIEKVYSKTDDARLPGAEQKKDLEPYCTKFGGLPKLTAKIECRVYRKP